MAIPEPAKIPFQRINIFLGFLFIIMLVLPPFYLGISLNLISKAILLIIFLLILLEKIVINKRVTQKDPINNHKIILSLVLILVPACLSIFNSINIEAYFVVFQNLLFALLFFYIFMLLFKNQELIDRVLNILIYVGLLNILAEFFIYINPGFFPGLFKNILDSNTVNGIYYYLSEGKGTYDTFSQTLIPIIFFLLFFKRNRLLNKILLTITLLLIITISVVANLRTYFIMALFSLFSSFLIFAHKIKKTTLINILILFVFLILNLNLISFINNINKTNILNRLLITDVVDANTINFRFNNWLKSAEIGNAFPFTGIGLGNFPEYTSSANKRLNWNDRIDRKGLPPSYFYPHNIFFNTFAETGYTGLIGLILLFLIYLKSDFTILFKNKYMPKIIVISFWTLIIYALFNPTSSFKFWIYFFLFRGLIYNLETVNLKIKE